jgi:hypothetical protein
MTTTTDPRGGWTSASNAAPDSACPGRHAAQRGLPEETSEDADSGTRCHAALAGADVTLDGDEQELAQRVAATRDKLVADWLRPYQLVDVFLEERLWIHDPDSNCLHSGQPDYVAIATDGQHLHAFVFDWKFGRIAVDDPADNAQLRDLAVLVDGRHKFELASVTVQIVQPFAGKFTPTLYDRDGLDRAADELMIRIQESNAPGAPRVAGEAQCKYCRARTRCPEFSAFVGQALPAPLTVERAKEVIEQAETMLPAMPDAKLARVLDVAGLAEKWLNLIKSEARMRLKERPGSIPGWELKAGVTRQAITGVQTVWQRFTANWPDRTAEFVAAVKIAKNALKDAVRAASGLKGKALDESVSALISGATTDTTTNPILKRVGESDDDE